MTKNKLLLLLALLLTAATGAWGMQIYISYPSWPTGTNVNGDGNLVLEMEASDSFENMKAKIEDKSGLNPTYMKLYFNSVEMANDETLNAKGVTSNSVLTLVYTLYTVSLKDGVKDAAKWTAKVGEGQAQALPIGGLKGDGSETVTLKYNGRLKVKSVKATSDAAPAEEPDPLAVPMTIEAITAGSIKVTSPKEGMQYSLDGGKTKYAVTTDDIVLNVGDKVQFYGNGTSITSYNGTIITGSGDGFTCKVYGNIMSLLDETGFATATTLSANNTFRSLFSDFTTLTDASGLLLPATTLNNSCYYSMFQGCSALTAAPALPATTLAPSCYYYMFQGCSALTAAPELPATKLATGCYLMMFMGCTALTTAPVLPATQLANNCYRQMFMGCSKLATVICLATSGINQLSSTINWLGSAGTQAEGTKTIYTVSTAEWPTGNNGIPTDWTRVNIDI